VPSPDSQDHHGDAVGPAGNPGGRPAGNSGGSSRPEPENIDAEFARIVASFDEAPDWPSGPEAAKGPVWPSGGPVLNQPSLLDGLDTFGAHLPDDTPEHFVPPPPPPIPRVPFAAIIALLAIVLGFVLFFDRDILPVGDPVSMLIGLAGVLGGTAALIMRLRPGGDDDVPPPDDGAVV
jgi:hypothetical protein